jgi:soluble lytic murein transglycosylase-like protein
MFNNVKRLSDEQLTQVLQQARSGNNDVLQAMGLYSPIPLMAEQLRRKNLREEASAQQQQAQGQQPPVIDQLAGVGSLPVPGMMEEQNYANGGIVAFSKGGSSGGYDYTNPYVPADILRAVHGAESTFGTAKTKYGPMVSSAGATGHFQFMPGTAKQFGLSREDTYDFDKSKMAAAKYLAQLHNEFGNWEEALRAYNAGSAGYRAIKAGRSSSPENENYFGRVSSFLPKEGQTPLSQRGVLRAGVGTGVTPDTSQTAQIPSGYKSEMAQLDAERQKRLDKVKEDYDEAMKQLGDAPKPSDKEAIRQKAIAEAAAINEPYLKEMDAMLQAGRPDPNTSLLKASLALMGGRGKGIGGALADIGAAGGIGLDAHQAALAKHQEAQRLALKSKFELAKGDKKYADELADAAVREDRVAANLYKTGLQNATQNRRYGEMSVDQAMDARLAAMRSAEEARLREMGLDRREAARLASENTRYQRSEDANKRAVMSQLHRSIDQFTKSKEMEPYIEAEKTKPEYKMKVKAGDRAGADAWAAEQARKKVVGETLATHGVSPEEYIRFSRGVGGLPLQPTASPATPASASVPPKGYVLDSSGNVKAY